VRDRRGPLNSLAADAVSRNGLSVVVSLRRRLANSSEKIVMRGAKPGERRGGRRRGTLNRATTKNKATLSELAQTYTSNALETATSTGPSWSW